MSSVPADAADVARVRTVVTEAVNLADQPSRQATGLGQRLPPATARVVGRGEWIASNLGSMRYLTDPYATKLLARSTIPPGAARAAVGIQVGAIFGFLSTRVLGQYEVFLPGGEQPGRLTLVGPNLLQAQREMAHDTDIAADELILGIVLHELGHRLQFEAVPWLRPHLKGVIDGYLARADIDPERIKDGLGELVGRITRGPVDLRDLLETFLTPEQSGLLRQTQAIMSLLEGHGNVVMDWGAELLSDDGVDPARVRRALNKRRNAAKGASRLIGKALGLGLKAAQYTVGEEFITDVAARHGRDTFNRVWDAPNHLPTTDELTDPDAWVTRVGPAA